MCYSFPAPLIRLKGTTYDFIRIDDRLQTMRDCDQSHVALELITKGGLNDSICLVICNSSISRSERKRGSEKYYQ